MSERCLLQIYCCNLGNLVRFFFFESPLLLSVLPGVTPQLAYEVKAFS